MKKNRLLTILVICMVLGTSLKQPAYASFETDAPIEIAPRYTYIASTMTTIANSSGNASCSATIHGISSSSSLKIFMYLEKYTNGTWTSYTTFPYVTKTGSSLTTTKSVSVSSGKYRVKASYYCNGENTVKYSASKTF